MKLSTVLYAAATICFVLALASIGELRVIPATNLGFFFGAAGLTADSVGK